LINAEKKLVIFRKRIAGLSRSTLERFVSRARRAVRLRDTVNVLVTNSRELRSLNRRFRGADKSTDVLSFPWPPLNNLHAQRVAGEVAISADIARDNANALGHSLAEEVKILVLHGVLHLAGFDHEHDRGEMARKESQLRRRLHLQGSLIERTTIERATTERMTTGRTQSRGIKSVTGKEHKGRKSSARQRNP
jgi:probable rRNA maturation factor